MKTNFLFIACLFFSISSFAQGGTWTWMKGSNSTNNLGSYGIKGVSAPSNNPPNRYQSAFWRDLDGNFWIFGGQCKQGINVTYMNDLWRYSTLNNEWTWVSGAQFSTNTAGVSGTLGIPSVNNFPSARGNGSICWVDNNGLFWLYGGESATGLNSDLWTYNTLTNEWTWVKGSQTLNQPAVYGIQGVPNINNTPGSRSETQSGWVDNLNNLWLNGGNKSATQSLFFNDLWKYNIPSNTWTWMKGSTTNNDPGSYGIKNLEDPTNLPPGRWSYTKWKSKDGNFYTFAGLIGNGNGTGTLNDVWEFNVASNNWTWISGSNAMNHPGTYNVKCAPDSFNYPPSRYENQTAQTVGCADVFWTFGGLNISGLCFNDLWIYNTLNNKWAWVSGNNTLNNPGTYGTQGIANASNMISARFGVSMWTDNTNNVWVFGGQNNLNNYFNDLWRFQPDTSCFSAPLVASFELQAPTDTALCLGDTATMGIPSTATIAWTPTNGVFPNADTSLLYFSPTSNTTYTITGADAGICPGIDTLVFSLTISPNTTPILIGPTDTLLCVGDSTIMNLDPNLIVSYFPSTTVIPNSDTSTLTFKPQVTTQYTVIGKYGACSLPDTLKFTIVVSNNANIVLTAPTPLNICKGSSTSMFINPSYNTTFSPITNVTPNSDTSILVFNPTSTTTYKVVSSTSGTCSGVDSIQFTINVDQPVKVVAPTLPTTSLCNGQSIALQLPQGIQFVSITPMSGVTLSNANTLLTFSPTSLTTYTLIVDGIYCSIPDTVQFSIDTKPTPTASFTMSPTIAPLSSAIFQLNNTSINATNYLWLLDNVAFSNQFHTTKSIKDTGDFCISLVATNAGNCSDTATVCGTVTEDPTYLFMPNAFSPNGDFLNDEFKPVASNVEFLQFVIYNRWGEKIFSNKTGYWGWDGKYKGVEMPAGVYFYYFKYKSQGKEKTMTGDLTLIR